MRRTLPGIFCLGAVMAPGVLAQNAVQPTQALMRVYEQEDGFVVGAEQRLYAVRFDATRTRILSVEITLAHPAPAKASAISAACELEWPDGRKTPGIFQIGITMAAGQTQSTGANMLWTAGKDKSWPPGTYTVRCTGGGLKLGEGKIQMVLNPPDVVDTEIRVAGIRFFPVADKFPAPADRKYASWHYAMAFHTDETRRIGTEIDFRHPALERAITVPVDCTYFTPTGQAMPTISTAYEAKVGSTSGSAAIDLGWDTAGNWAAGNYLAVCSIYGHPVGYDRFRVY